MRDVHAYDAFKIDRPLVLFLEDWIDQINSEAMAARTRGRDVSRSAEFVAVIQAVLDKHYEEIEAARGEPKPAAPIAAIGVDPKTKADLPPSEGAVILNFMAYRRDRYGAAFAGSDASPAA
jgi:hypothetical protein